MLAERLGADAAWTIAVRVKRGLAMPGEPGTFAKDAVYHTGYAALREWLAAGGELKQLYVGKVALSHPVAQWIEAGWVYPGVLPPLWLNPPESNFA